VKARLKSKSSTSKSACAASNQSCSANNWPQ
jgi:hypothetical protein